MPWGESRWRREHVTPEDWLRHQDYITQLYIAEDKTLSETIRVMERDHEFFAL